MTKLIEDFKLAQLIKKFKKEKKITALLPGVFDVLHIGHIDYFESIKKKSDILVISVTDDPYVNKGPGRPVFSIENRVRMISAIKVVDYVLVSKAETAEKIIKTIKPNIYAKGQDYKIISQDLSKNIKKEIKAIKSVGGKFITTNSPMHSSSKIINQETSFLSENLKVFLKKINKEKIKNSFYSLIFNKINKKILIIGDPIIDIYNYVKIQGKSSKSNILSSKYLSTNEFGGGTILVANVLAEYIKKVDFLTFYNSYNKTFLKRFLKEKNINLKKINTPIDKFIIKKRFIDQYSNNRLYQINYNEKEFPNKNLSKKISTFLIKNHKKYEKILIFDFGHNFIDKQIIKTLEKISSKTFINCQSNSSNFGYNLISKYKKAHTICMDEQEFRLSVQDKNTDIKNLITIHRKFIDRFNNFIITMGKNGCFHINNKKINFIPTVYTTFTDTTGSGDVFFSIYTSLIHANKFSIPETCFISHIAAGIHANTVGNEKKFDKISIYKNLDILLK